MTDAAAILNQISDTLAQASPSFEETAGLVTRTTADTLGSTCVLWLAEEGSNKLAIAATSDPAATPSACMEQTGWEDRLQDAVFAAATLETASPFTLSPEDSGGEEGSGRGGAPATGRPGQPVLTAVPLRLRNGTTGALGVVRPASLGDLGDLELALLRQLGDRAALALDCVGLQAAADRERRLRLRAETARRAGSVAAADAVLRQTALADLGRWALIGLDYGDLASDAVKLLGEHLTVDAVHVFDAFPDPDFLSLKGSAGHSVGDNEWTSAEPTSSPASFALVSQQTVVSDDLATEERFDVPELWSAAGIVSVIEVPIPGPESPAGVVGVGRRLFAPFSDEEANFVSAVASVLAVAAARRQVEGAIRAQAASDPLTGLPNRFLLADHSAGSAAPPGAFPPLSGADRTVLVLDIDRFKEINDTLGHAIGDLVLLEISRRLSHFGGPVELVARLGSDEFALVAHSPGSPAGDEQLAEQLLSVLGEPFDVGGVKLRLRASIGIAPRAFDDAGNALGVPVLLRRAESAMYQAKSEHVRMRRYSDNLERTSLLRLTLASELAEAIDHDQLHLDYQPKLSTAGGRVTGVEALVRWLHPTRGLLPPDVFVPLAEQTGIIRELTSWVLARALAECAGWRRAGFPMPVAVNLSAGTVQDASLPDTVMAALARAGLPAEAIELEITESAVMRDPVGALRTLEVLAAEGVRFALDDFGTGYSSLSYLQRLPFASVKIDKSFVSPLADPDNGVARAIVTAVIELGHSLGLEVIAEGVDSTRVLEAVTTMGCDAVQGFHLAMPMSGDHLRDWITARAAGDPTPANPAGAASRR